MVMVTLLIIGTLTGAFNIQPVSASGTVYIRGDGRVDPPTAPISSLDNVTYTFTGNINDFLVIERSNIVVDGAGYTLYGNGSGRGVDLASFGYLSNITIKNMEIRGFEYAVYLEWCWNINISRNNIEVGIFDCGIWLHWSWNNTIVGNTLTSAWGGVAIDLNTSSENTLAENYITGNEHAIRLNYSLNCRIIRNNIDGNGRGIELTDSSDNNILARNNVTWTEYGITLSTSSNNTLAENNVTLSNEAEIILRGSSNNSLTGNTIIGREPITQQGIWLNSSSNNNTLAGNNITDNKYGISLTGSSNNTLSGNNVTSNEYGIWLGSSSNNTLTENNATANGCGIFLINSSNNNILEENDIAYGWNGISLRMSSNNTFVRNNITGPEYGVFLTSSSNNTLAENNVTGTIYGIWLEGSSDNHIYHNNFMHNAIQAVIINSVCAWDDGYPSGGNYWSDYTGVDFYHGPYQNLTGCDGVGDTPYTIDANNTDHYPLMKPYPQSPDVAVINVTLLKTVVGIGYPILINVTVENQGYFTETFNLTLYAFTMPPAIPIKTITVSNLSIGETRTIALRFNTTAVDKGIYTIITVADTVPREIDTADNAYPNGAVTLTIPGDLNGDFTDNYKDLYKLAIAYGSDPTKPNWDPYADINSDDRVNYKDLYILAANYGEDP